MRRAAPIVFVLAWSASVSGKPCPNMEMTPKILTPAGGTIAAGGGIVIAQVAAAKRDDRPRTDDASPYVVRAGTRLIAPGVRPIAPGLDLYDVGDAAGELVLEDDQQAELLRVRRGKGSALPAPRLKRIWSNRSHRTPRRSYTYLAAELDGKTPATALALVVYGADGAPRSWGSAVKDAASITLYSSGGCNTHAPGTVASSVGDSVRLAWLDSAGRLSKLSAPIKVVQR